MEKQSKKPLINFNNFWSSLKSHAKAIGLNKGEWFKKASINYQRFSEFDKGTRDLSARYFLKLIGGLNLKTENAEKVLGHKFTDKQKKLLKFESLVDSNRDWLEILLDDPELIKITKSIIDTKSK